MPGSRLLPQWFARRRSRRASPRARSASLMGMEAADGTPEELDTFVRDQISETVSLVHYLGMKPIED